MTFSSFWLSIFLFLRVFGSRFFSRRSRFYKSLWGSTRLLLKYRKEIAVPIIIFSVLLVCSIDSYTLGLSRYLPIFTNTEVSVLSFVVYHTTSPLHFFRKRNSLGVRKCIFARWKRWWHSLVSKVNQKSAHVVYIFDERLYTSS